MTEAVTTFEPMANTNCVTLQVRIAEQLPLVNGDCDKLYQVLTNLLENAMRLTEPGGQVDVDTSVQEEGRTQLCVRDTSRGKVSRKREMSSSHSTEEAGSRRMGQNSGSPSPKI